MNTGEILLMSLLFVTGFMVTELIVSHFIYIVPLNRFILRIVLLAQYSLLLYYFFDSRDKAINNKEFKENEAESEGITSEEKGEK